MNRFLALLKSNQVKLADPDPGKSLVPSKAQSPVLREAQSPVLSEAQGLVLCKAQTAFPVLRKSRQTSFLRKAPGDFPPEERALRDEKVQFIREVYEYSRRANVAEWKAAEHVAEDCAAFFPRLVEGGKNGACMLTYTNYRNWLTGTSSKPGLGRLADGSPDYDNADVLLRNYGSEHVLYGDPAFWETFKAHFLQGAQQKVAKIYRLLELKWRIEYPGLPIPALYQVREYIRNRYPKRFIAYMRRGENFYLQHYRDFVVRDPGTIRPNEAWVADSQDCDFMIRVPRPDGCWEAVRPKICVIMDIKSQHVVSIQLVWRNEHGKVAVTNEIIRNAFALGVWYYGRPRVFLTDNGADYCKAGFTLPVTFTPAVSNSKVYSHSIMLALDVMHLTADPYNARAKYVERFFRELAEYSRAARGYVGNMPENRPATAKVWAKPGNCEHLMSVQDACEFLGAMIQLYHSRPAPESKFLRGLSPDQAFAPELRYTRPAFTLEEYKRAFLLPLTEARIMENRGPSVRVENRRFVAVPQERDRAWRYDGKPVMVKTDLLNDEHVYLYDLDGTYICEARTEVMVPYFTRLGSSDEDRKLLEGRMEEIRAEKKYFDTMAMDETGGWHKLDPWRLYQLPREAFLGPARLRLLDSMYSVKGETHNPKIYVLPEELRACDVAKPAGAEKPRQIKEPVCAENCATQSTKTDPARKRMIGDAIRKVMLGEETPGSSGTAVRPDLSEILDATPDENTTNQKRILDENFI